MALTFHPKAGVVLMCDYSGFKAPEMVKTRPVVVVSPNHLKRPGLYTVVPLSGSEPETIEPYHYKLPKNPMPEWEGDIWAKCDMVATVAIARLDRIKLARGHYVTRAITPEDLEAIRACLRYALGIA